MINFTEDMKNQSFDNIIKDIVFDFLDDNMGISYYACDLSSEITRYDNCDGTFVLGTYSAMEFIKHFWDEASDTYEYFSGIDCDPIELNPFSNPEKFTYYMEVYGVEKMVDDITMVTDKWNEQIRLTPNIIEQIKKEIDEKLSTGEQEKLFAR